MKVVVGLGNPGKAYERSRHNVGFMAVDQLLAQLGGPAFSMKANFQAEISKQGEVIIVKPQTFMNRSGQAVRAVLDYYTDWQAGADAPWLYVFHDDLDLVVGTHKLQLGTGPKQHNGLLSLYEHLGTKNFWHGRIGVDGRGGDRSFPSDQYVLQPPLAAELPLIEDSITVLLNQLTAA